MIEIRIKSDELATVREAMRGLNRMVAELQSGEREKLVLLQRNQMAAVVLSVERYAELVKDAGLASPQP